MKYLIPILFIVLGCTKQECVPPNEIGALRNEIADNQRTISEMREVLRECREANGKRSH